MSQRSIIVTGGFGALGRAVASAFVGLGDRVARVDFARVPAEPIDSVLDIGGIDLTDSTAAQQAVAKVSAAFGTVDVLVNVAGGFVWQTLEDGGSDTWARMFALNASTCVNMSKAALPELLKRTDARIINIGAAGALSAVAGMGAYAASKEAVHKLTQSLADELKQESITVNAVLPSIIDTPANRADMPTADYTQWVKPSTIADVILFLASTSARCISGALIPVTKGG